MNASNIQTPGARMWLYGCDAAEEVCEVESGLRGCLLNVQTGTKIPRRTVKPCHALNHDRIGRTEP